MSSVNILRKSAGLSSIYTIDYADGMRRS